MVTAVPWSSRALLAALLLGAALPAGATLRTIEQAYELTRSQVQLPGKPEGTSDRAALHGLSPGGPAGHRRDGLVRPARDPATRRPVRRTGRVSRRRHQPRHAGVRLLRAPDPSREAHRAGRARPGNPPMNNLSLATSPAPRWRRCCWCLSFLPPAPVRTIPSCSSATRTPAPPAPTSSSSSTRPAAWTRWSPPRRRSTPAPDLRGLLRQRRPVLLHQRRHACLRQSQRPAEDGQSLRRVPPGPGDRGLLPGLPPGLGRRPANAGTSSIAGPAGGRPRVRERPGRRRRRPDAARTSPPTAPKAPGPPPAPASRPGPPSTRSTTATGSTGAATRRSVEKSRIDIVKEAVNALMTGLRDVNVGVMRFNGDEGGSVVAAARRTSRRPATR